MTEISFYILPSSSAQERLLFTCKLIEKAYKSQHFSYIYTHDHQQSQQLDNQLWSFKASSFIPHQILAANPPEFEQSILIGAQNAPEKWQNLIINLSFNYPENCDQPERILEILDNNAAIKQAGRVRYKKYQQQGHQLTTHTL